MADIWTPEALTVGPPTGVATVTVQGSSQSPDQVLDIHLELDPRALATEPDPTQAIAEASRRAAEAVCERQRMRLRHPDPREVVTKRALVPVTGEDVLLVATRWIADPLG